MHKWISVLDDQTCDECRALHGKIISSDDPRPPLHARFENDEHPQACRCVLKPARVLAVGERFNYHRWWRPQPKWEYSFELRKNLGFYNRTGPKSRRGFLNSLGVYWDDGINLLWPSPIPGYWNKQEAGRVAYELIPKIDRSYDVVLLFGKKVCEAFDIKYSLLEQQGKYVPLPHPSGRCRTWNDCSFLNEVRRFFK